MHTGELGIMNTVNDCFRGNLMKHAQIVHIFFITYVIGFFPRNPLLAGIDTGKRISTTLS